MKNMEMEYRKLIAAVNAIIVVYGPLDVFEIAEKMEFYFPELKKYDDWLEEIVQTMEQQDKISEKDGRYCMIPFEQYEELMKFLSNYNIQFAKKEKIFDKDELLRYGDPYHLEGKPEYDDIVAFTEKLRVSKKRKTEIRDVIITAAIGILDIEDFISNVLNGEYRLNVNEREVMEVMENFMAHFPRGFLGGYSLDEARQLMENV